MDNLESPNGLPKPAPTIKTPSKLITIVLPVVFFVLVSSAIAFQVEPVKKEILAFAEKLGLHQPEVVKATYYQWFDDRGQLIISPNKPKNTEEFVVIEADTTLMENKNNIDKMLIAKSEAYKHSVQNPNKTPSSSLDAGSISGLANYTKSFEKAKYCIEMAQRVAAVNRDLKQDEESNELREKHKKDCVDGFEIKGVR